MIHVCNNRDEGDRITCTLEEFVNPNLYYERIKNIIVSLFGRELIKLLREIMLSMNVLRLSLVCSCTACYPNEVKHEMEE